MECRVHKCLLLITIIMGVRSTVAENPSVLTSVGEIVGTSHTVTVDNRNYTVNKYHGIPYGQPPVGERRFLKALPVVRLTSLFHADTIGDACLQLYLPGLSKPRSMSEDCLFLNVYVPNAEPDAKAGFAVMVFIYGGGFQYGSSESYGGGTLAAYGNVIVVTVNYRIGIMGFLSTGDHNAPGNMGLWDQQLALQWVHNNIGAFGGDKDRVTVFGQSAGAISAIYQGLLPENKDLIHRIIAQSGSPDITSQINVNPVQTTRALAEFFNCNTESNAVMVDCLRQIDSEVMYKEIDLALTSDPTKAPIFTHHPIIDGDFLQPTPSDFSKTTEKGKKGLMFYRSLDLIMGVNSHEGAAGVSWMAGSEDPETFEPTRERMKSQLIPTLLSSLSITVDELSTKLVLSEYTDWSNPYDPKTIRKEFIRLVGDSFMVEGSVAYAQLHCEKSKKANTFFYVFSVNQTNRQVPLPSWINGANHGEELGFVFGFDEENIHDFERVSSLTFQEPKTWEWEVTLRVMRYWSTFAKTGTPNRPVDNPEWPKYDLETQQALDINKDMGIIDYVYAREFDFWKHIILELDSKEAGRLETSGQGVCYANVILIITMLGSIWYM